LVLSAGVIADALVDLIRAVAEIACHAIRHAGVSAG
jgi:hypothetical protein